LSLGHGPTPLGFSMSAVVCTRSTWLRWANPHVPLPSVSGPWPKLLFRFRWRYPSTPWNDGQEPSLEAMLMMPSRRWRMWHLPPSVSDTSLTRRSSCSRSVIRRSASGARALRPLVSSLACSSAPSGPRWPSTHSTYSTCSTTPVALSSSSVLI
jgi:hypothetical protein